MALLHRMLHSLPERRSSNTKAYIVRMQISYVGDRLASRLVADRPTDPILSETVQTNRNSTLQLYQIRLFRLLLLFSQPLNGKLSSLFSFRYEAGQKRKHVAHELPHS